MPPNMPTNNKTWEDKLYTLIQQEIECSKNGKIEKCRWDDILDFIRNLLLQQKEEIVRKVEGTKKPIDSERTPFALQEVIQNMGYNQALQDIIDLLTK